MIQEERRFWLRHGRGKWYEATLEQFVDAERSAGFWPKDGGGPLVTNGFSNTINDSQGRVTYGDPRKNRERDADFIAAVNEADEARKVSSAQ